MFQPAEMSLRGTEKNRQGCCMNADAKTTLSRYVISHHVQMNGRYRDRGKDVDFSTTLSSRNRDDVKAFRQQSQATEI